MKPKSFFKFLPPFFLLAGFFVFGFSAQAADLVIDTDTTWVADSVHIIEIDQAAGETGIIIEPGATLTIEPGAAVKLGENAGILVAGNLLAAGSAAKPVIFTSIKDDGAAGDTNGDGSATAPASGDWYGIIVSGPADPAGNGRVVMDYVEIKYGGNYLGSEAGVISVFAAQEFSVTHGAIINNRGAVLVNTPNFKINYSNIYNPDFCQDFGGIPYCGTTLFNRGAVAIDLVNNYWGHANGPTVAPPDFRGTAIMGPANYWPYLSEPLVFEPAGPDPVILIPGILGSWPGLSGHLELDPILNTYDNLWEALRQAGYETGKTLFALPYEWRQSNVLTAQELKDKIEAVKAICHCDKVDLIGHSMGGLIARQYIESDDYANDVDQLIFLATPHQGATNAYLTWEAGEVGPDFSDFLKEKIFQLEALKNGYPSVFKYIQGVPIKSIEELLPTYNYLRDKDEVVFRFYPDGYPINSFLDGLNQPENLAKLNGVDITNVVADAGAESTLNYLRVVSSVGPNGEWEHGYPDGYEKANSDHGLEFGPGDGTVPLASNGGFFGASSDVLISNSDHGSMVADSQKAVIKELTGVEPTTEVRANLIKKILMIRIFSPADFQVVAPDGKIIGKDFATGGIINEIDGAFYTGFDGDIEFAVIPEPLAGDYRVNLQGTGEGEYRLSASYLDDSMDIDRDFVGRIAAGENAAVSFGYSGQSETPMTPLILEIKTTAGLAGFINDSFSRGLITKANKKDFLLKKLEHLSASLADWDAKIAGIRSQIETLTANTAMKPAKKQKELERLNRLLAIYETQRAASIERNFDFFERELEYLKKYKMIDAQCYDIIKTAVEYLRNNL